MLVQELDKLCGSIVTLDGRYISDIGIVSGESFKPEPLRMASYCFGCLANSKS